jgi:hypothetical protein
MGRGGTRLRQQYVADEDDDGSLGFAGESPPTATAEPARAPARASKFGDESRPAASSVFALGCGRRRAATSQWAAAENAFSRGSIVERDDIVKGYEFEKGRFVLFTPAELKALQEARGRRSTSCRSSGARGRPDLLRQGVLPRARQARREDLFAAARRNAAQ